MPVNVMASEPARGNQMQSENQNGAERPLADDLLHGAKEIANFLGITERQAFHQIEEGNIAVARMGRKIVGSKSALRRRLVPDQ